VTSSTAEPGHAGVLQVYAKDAFGSGLGAWTVDIEYDSDAITIVQCAPTIQISECNTSFGDETVRLTGARHNGKSGQRIVLAQIVYDCKDAEGESPLDVTTTNVQDGMGQAWVDYDELGGSVTCAER
jgi:hypothetical protein